MDGKVLLKLVLFFLFVALAQGSFLTALWRARRIDQEGEKSPWACSYRLRLPELSWILRKVASYSQKPKPKGV